MFPPSPVARLSRFSALFARPSHSLAGRLLVAAFLFLFALAGPASAVDTTWNVPEGDWSNAANWDTGNLPTSSDNAYINNNGIANVANGYAAQAASILTGYGAGASGTVNVHGPGSSLTVLGINMGVDGTGYLNITGGGRAESTVSDFVFGFSAGSLGVGTVSGQGSTLASARALVVGMGGTGILNITGGGTASIADMTILGSNANSSGTVNVSGQGSALTGGSALYLLIGSRGAGSLNLTDGGTASAGTIHMAQFSAATGRALVGAGSSLISSGNIYMGGDAGVAGGAGWLGGTGTVTANNGAGTIKFWKSGTGTSAISPGDRWGEAGTLTLKGNAVFEDGVTFELDRTASGGSDWVQVTGTAEFGATLNVNLSSLARSGVTTPIITANSFTSPTPSLGALTLNGESISTSRATLDNANLSVIVAGNLAFGYTVSDADSKYMTWTGGAADGLWNLSSANWSDGLVTTQFLDGDSVTFTTSTNTAIAIQGTGKTVSGLVADVTANTLTINGNLLVDRNSATGAEVTSPTGNLVKTGAGTLALNGNNEFLGTTLIQGGTLRAITANSLGAAEVAVSTGATLDLAGTGTMYNYIWGTGDLLKSGAGYLALNNNVEVGAVEVSDGTFSINGFLETEIIDTALGTTLNVNELSIGSRFFKTLDLTNNLGVLNLNTLSVYGTSNAITGAANMPSLAGKNLNFYLPGTAAAGDQMLYTDNTLDIDGAKLNLFADGYLTNLVQGDTIDLINSTSGTVANTSPTAMYGATKYRFSVVNDPSMLQLLFLGSGAGEEAKAYLEGGLAGLFLVSEDGRRAATLGIPEMMRVTENGPGMGIMAVASGSHDRVDTGSHIDVDGFSLISGPVWRFDNNMGITRLAVFAEGGWGSYDTYNSFSTGSVDGDGDIEHYGGGVMLRHDFNSSNGFTPYVEASGRVGWVDTDFDSGDLGQDASFDSDTMYWGAHAGLGLMYSLSEKDLLDGYAKIFWTRQESDSVTTDAGERLKLDSADSLSTRIGARYTRVFTENVSAFAGAAWEHEFDGKLDGSLDGTSLDAPDLKGDSAFFELGLNFTPTDSNWRIDLSAFGNAGTREGIGGRLSVGYEF